ncbi:glycosyltransferase family 2 protein [Candidatus Parabeggiatoa sp. HSG14]|uniref:glycosyltransferase family 2 protein n=1 Tax=Candidatus Parabeggiatoa sp. HSG14 TaxID=3055593 RepID=UPI0025A6E23D|nr:glycosyltransferase family 2 protein [Thiotrichales bacterium HSG14]
MNKNHQKTEKDYQEQLSVAQAEIKKYQAENARLQKALNERTQDINKLIQWTQSLQQDVLAVYHSVTWQIGNFIAQIILKLLRRPVTPTARDHINKILTTFESWKINYFQNRQQHGLQPYTPWHDTREYALWIKQYDTLSQTDLVEIKNQMEQWQHRPLISLLMSADAPNARWLHNAIESVQAQIYPHWELCIVYQSALPEMVTKYARLDNRIKLIDCIENKKLADNLNNALTIANGDFIALMGYADQLPSHALYKIAEILNTYPDTDLIYTDEDKLDIKGRRYDPYFKSDWNPDLFYSQNFLRYFTVYRCTVVNDISGFCSDYQSNEDYDLALRFIEKTSAERIRHIPQVLYHHQEILGENGENLDKNSPNTVCQILQAHFQRLNQSVKVVEAVAGHTRVIYPLPEKLPLVSLIIPTRDKLKLLRGTINGILNQTDYKNIEVIIMDNGSVEPDTLEYFKKIQNDSRISIIHHAAPFNYSQLNNIGISQAKGEIIGLINNDLEVISSEWLGEMVSHALRPKIGAVGAKLYYANDTIQHAGVIVGLGGMAGHNFKYLARETPGYHWKPFLIQNYSAVTAACLIMRRQVFEEVGGLNEKHLKVAFNDVDLCLRIREKGYRIVWTPYAELYHLESASRGTDNTLKKYLRLRHELNFMQSKWGDTLLNDPYYNPNLTIEYEDFALAYPPRINR